MTTTIREARVRLGIGVRELARRCEVSGATVVGWERSEARDTIALGTLRRALAGLGETLRVDTGRAGASERLQRREERLGLELHRAVAQKLVFDPDEVIEHARGRLDGLRATARGGALDWVADWERLLDARGVGSLVDVMLGVTRHDIDMRSVSPFTGLLSPDERLAVAERAAA